MSRVSVCHGCLWNAVLGLIHYFLFQSLLGLTIKQALKWNQSDLRSRIWKFCKIGFLKENHLDCSAPSGKVTGKAAQVASVKTLEIWERWCYPLSCPLTARPFSSCTNKTPARYRNHTLQVPDSRLTCGSVNPLCCRHCTAPILQKGMLTLERIESLFPVHKS